MKDELPELIADIKEQVSYLQDLGVETLKSDVPEITLASPTGDAPVVPVRIDIPVPKIEIAAKPARSTAGSRLTSMPSLSKRSPTPSRKSETPQLPEAAAIVPTGEPAITETIFGDI